MKFVKNPSDFVNLVSWLQDDDNWGGADADAEVTRLKFAVQQALRTLPKGRGYEVTHAHLETLLSEVENQSFWEMINVLLHVDIPS